MTKKLITTKVRKLSMYSSVLFWGLNKLMYCSLALFLVQPLGYITLDWTCSTGNSRRRAAGCRWRRANQTESLRAPFTDKNSTKKKRYFLEKSQENLSLLHPMQYWMFC